ncbi:MAG: hypothetical protein AB7K09_17185 [Planctomycetota bacterium]
MSFTFTYANLACSGSTPRLPDGPFQSHTDGRIARFGCDMLVVSSGASGLASECAAVESAFSTANAALVVTLDGATMLALDPADAGSALATRATIRKPGTGDDSDRTRRYRVEVEADLPASAAGASGGFVSETVTQDIDAAGRATTTFAGRYTASSGKTARENYSDGTTGAAARATAWLDVIGDSAGHELMREETRELAAGAQLEYTRVYRQRLVPGTADGSASADYQIETLTLQRDLGGEHADSAAASPARYRIAFAASVQLATHDYQALQAFYEATIRPALLARLQETWLAGSRVPSSRGPVIDAERVSFEADRSRVTAEWVLLAPAGSSLLALSRRQRIERDARITPRKVQDGQPHTHLVYCPGEVVHAEVTLVAESLETAWRVDAQDELAVPPGDSSGARWVLTGETRDESSAHIGQHQADLGGSALRCRSETTFRWLLVAEPAGGGLQPQVPPLVMS